MTSLYTKYTTQNSYLEWRTLSITLVTSNPQMSEMKIHKVGKSPVRMSKVE